MPHIETPFGKLLGFDPKLFEDFPVSEPLALRERTAHFLAWTSKAGKVLFLFPNRFCRGPNRLIVERLPDSEQVVPTVGWSIKRDGMYLRNSCILAFTPVLGRSSEVLPPIRDFPGHHRNSLNRFFRRYSESFPVSPATSPELAALLDIKNRLTDLTVALRSTNTEAVETPLLRLLGHGKSLIPEGDSAISGLSLIGLAFRQGKRIRVDWVHRLIVEIHRFFRRTTLFGEQFLRPHLQGRTTGHQERLLIAMDRDLESQSDHVIHEIAESEDFPGLPFLLGAAAALEIIHADIENRFNALTMLRPRLKVVPPSRSQK
jgi:hypothetical protein